MDSMLFINRLKSNVDVFNSILNNIDDSQACWKPKPAKWSILEVVNHLYDEEIEDFRKRIDLTLKNPNTHWPGIDPQAWVTERSYNKQDFNKIKKLFFKERKKTLAWLQNLNSPHWSNVYHHPKIGKISAGDLLTAWVTHDFMHIRQITLLNLEYFIKLAEPYNSQYALPQ